MIFFILRRGGGHRFFINPKGGSQIFSYSEGGGYRFSLEAHNFSVTPPTSYKCDFPKFDQSDCCDSVCVENSTGRIEDSMVTVGSVNAVNSGPSKPDEGSTCADAARCKEESSQSNQPTPFDSDAESDYDDEAPCMKHWQEYRGQCQDLNCQYNPDVEIGHPDLNQRWGLRPNGTFKVYYACALCGRVICPDCLWIRRRHFHHRFHLNWYSRNNPPDPINVKNLIAGIF